MIYARRPLRHYLTVLAFSLVAGAMLLALLLLSGAVTFGTSYRVQALVPQAGSLTQGTSVAMAGVRVGTVTGVRRHGNGALVDIRIDNDEVAPLAEDTTATLAVRTPLGENYIQLRAGRSSEKVESGGRVGSAPDDSYVDIDQILSVLKGPTRTRARQLLRGLGRAVGDRGDELNRTVRGASGALVSASELTLTLRNDHERIAALVDQLGRVAGAVGERGESLRALATQGRRTFEGLAARDEALRETLRELPPLLRRVRGTTTTLERVSDVATPVVGDLADAVREVRPSVRSLAPASSAGTRLLGGLRTAAPRLEETLKSVSDASDDLVGTVRGVDRVLCQANPIVRYARPYVGDVVNLVADLGAAANSYDPMGHVIRVMPVAGENSLHGLPDEVSESLFTLAHTGVLEQVVGMTFKPFPKPWEANSGFRPGDPVYSGPKGIAKSGFVYPRIKADC